MTERNDQDIGTVALALARVRVTPAPTEPFGDARQRAYREMAIAAMDTLVSRGWMPPQWSVAMNVERIVNLAASPVVPRSDLVPREDGPGKMLVIRHNRDGVDANGVSIGASVVRIEIQDGDKTLFWEVLTKDAPRLAGTIIAVSQKEPG